MNKIEKIRNAVNDISLKIKVMEVEKEAKSEETLHTSRGAITISIKERGIKILSRQNGKMAQELVLSDLEATALRNVLKELYS